MKKDQGNSKPTDVGSHSKPRVLNKCTGPWIRVKLTAKADLAARRFMAKRDIRTKAEAVNVILEESDLRVFLSKEVC